LKYLQASLLQKNKKRGEWKGNLSKERRKEEIERLPSEEGIKNDKKKSPGGNITAVEMIR